MDIVEVQTDIHHFSHQHSLKLISYPNSNTEKILCSACTKEAKGWSYTCETCKYCLHKACSKLPQKLYHGCDRKHALVLLASPAYGDGKFVCNACGASGTAFCYHCAQCQLDLHPVCAFMDPSLLSKAHDHALDLCYEPPYENKLFSCDLCEKPGSDHWLYRCGKCEFDVHLKCAKATQEHSSM
ncbi:protein VACUOLELESS GAMETOPHYTES-like [Salvia miltiorrhiza]|uniref:protein VACUOLELESS GAMETOPHYTES-like n=1 Tax=Salvia miltiorrhiza TaxID=226208 RepID=UPI0025AB78FA|nr:protein VACUOLELESS GAMETOPHYTES-like [Salvia miltiorrhiza]